MNFYTFQNHIRDIKITYTHETRIAVEFWIDMGIWDTMCFSSLIDIENDVRQLDSPVHEFMGSCPLCKRNYVWYPCEMLNAKNPSTNTTVQHLFDYIINTIKEHPETIEYEKEESENHPIQPTIFNTFYENYQKSKWEQTDVWIVVTYEQNNFQVYEFINEEEAKEFYQSNPSSSHFAKMIH